MSRFSFLGFRTMRKVMVANGDADKTIWMTELGWSTATSPCQRGAFAGRKPAGVPEAQPGREPHRGVPLPRAHPYVESGLWFNLHDTTGEHPRARPLRAEPPGRLAQAVVGRVPRDRDPGDRAGRPVRRLRRPGQLQLQSPARTTRYVGALTLSAVASDRSGVSRVTFRVNGRTIRNFTGRGRRVRARCGPRVAGREAPPARHAPPDRRRARRAPQRERADGPHPPRVAPARDAAHADGARRRVGRRRARRVRRRPRREGRAAQPLGRRARRVAAAGRLALEDRPQVAAPRRPTVPRAAAPARRAAGGSERPTSRRRRTARRRRSRPSRAEPRAR